jgi:hypothetical protein
MDIIQHVSKLSSYKVISLTNMILIVCIMLCLCVMLTVWFSYLHKYNKSQAVSRKLLTKKAYRITYNNSSLKNKISNNILTDNLV